MQFRHGETHYLQVEPSKKYPLMQLKATSYSITLFALFVTTNALNAQILPPIARLALTDTTWMDPPVQTALLDA